MRVTIFLKSAKHVSSSNMTISIGIVNARSDWRRIRCHSHGPGRSSGSPMLRMLELRIGKLVVRLIILVSGVIGMPQPPSPLFWDRYWLADVLLRRPGRIRW